MSKCKSRLSRQKPTTANLHLIGPECLLPYGNMDITVERSHTWNQVLTRRGLRVTPDGIAFVCTRSYIPSLDQGRRAELNETVEDFVKGFRAGYAESKRRYTVRVCTKDYDPGESNTGWSRTTSIVSSASSAAVAKQLLSDSNVRLIVGSVNSASCSSQSTSLAETNAPSTSKAVQKSAENFDAAQTQKDANISTVEDGISTSPGSPPLICLDSDCDGDLNDAVSNIPSACENERQQNQDTNGPLNVQGAENDNECSSAKRQKLSGKISLRDIPRDESSESSSDSSDDEGDPFLVPPRPPPRYYYSGRWVQRQAAGPRSAFFDNVTTGQHNIATDTDGPHAYDDDLSNQQGGEGQGQGTQENEEESIDDDQDQSFGNVNNDDGHLFPPMASVRTTAADEEFQLRAEGIAWEDIGDVVQRRIELFDNSYKLKARNELRKLKMDNNRYYRFFAYAPLVVNMMEVIFKPE